MGCDSFDGPLRNVSSDPPANLGCAWEQRHCRPPDQCLPAGAAPARCPARDVSGCQPRSPISARRNLSRACTAVPERVSSDAGPPTARHRYGRSTFAIPLERETAFPLTRSETMTMTQSQNKALVLQAFDTLFKAGLRCRRAFLVTRLYPTQRSHCAGPRGSVRACESGAEGAAL